ncbi:MAG: hypothetical protein HC925_02225 [Coleofasciculaceae cyanobacterium SM2_3_26]|nr:hypothetical protein [Coleofasciculaceae cyanobacterium SM2_3_26]
MTEVAHSQFYGLFDMVLSLLSIVLGLPFALIFALLAILPAYYAGLWITTTFFRK